MREDKCVERTRQQEAAPHTSDAGASEAGKQGAQGPWVTPMLFGHWKLLQRRISWLLLMITFHN